MYVMQSQRPRKTARERPKLRLAAPRRAFARVSLAGPPSRGVKRTTLNRPHVADERSCERYVLAIPQGKRGVHCYNAEYCVTRDSVSLSTHTGVYTHKYMRVHTCRYKLSLRSLWATTNNPFRRCAARRGAPDYRWLGNSFVFAQKDAGAVTSLSFCRFRFFSCETRPPVLENCRVFFFHQIFSSFFASLQHSDR